MLAMMYDMHDFPKVLGVNGKHQISFKRTNMRIYVQDLPKYLWVLLLKVFLNPIHLGAQTVNHVFSVFQQESLARESFDKVLAPNILSTGQNTFREPPPFPSRFQSTCFLPESSSDFAYN